MANLAGFLARAGRTPFGWGVFDCQLWLADWVLEVRGVDPAAEFRGRYGTRLGAERLLRRRGGPEAHVGTCATQAGLQPTDDPVAGDIGLLPASGQLLGGICTGPRWAVLTVTGLLSAPMRPTCAWRV